MNIEQLYFQYKKELENTLKLGVQINEYYSFNLKTKDLQKEKDECIIKENQLTKEIYDELGGKIFKLTNGNYIAYNDNIDIVECRIREYEVYEY